MKISAIPEPSSETCNTNNHKAYQPFHIAPDRPYVTLDTQWFFNVLTEETQLQVRRYLEEAGYVAVWDTVAVPHNHADAIKGDDVKRAIMWRLYHIHLRQYDFHRWSPRSVLDARLHVLDLDASTIDTLVERAHAHLLRPRHDRHLVEHFPTVFQKQLQEAFATVPSDGFFFKLSTITSKKDNRLRPIHTVNALLHALVGSPSLLDEYALAKRHPNAPYYQLKLILRPWDTRITEQNEYRLFVHDGTLVGVSQQHWSRDVGLTEAIVKRHTDALQRLTTQLMQHDNFPYRYVVLDAFVDDANNTAHLIECNPWGAWNASGSSLFQLARDFPSSSILQVRYVKK